MSLNESASIVVSLVLALLTGSSMQILKPLLTSTQPMTIVAGFLASLVFVFLLTAIGNLERVVFGKGYHTGWVEAALSLVLAVMTAASVHRVAATVCVIFSGLMLHGISKLSQEAYGSSSAGGTAASAHTANVAAKKKK